MVGHEQLGPVGDNQPGGGHSLGLHLRQLAHQLGDVQGHAVADHVGDMGVKNSGREDVQGEPAVVVDDGVARIGSALKADHHVGLLGQQIGDLALAFVAPVGTYNRFDHNLLPPGTGIRNGENLPFPVRL